MKKLLLLLLFVLPAATFAQEFSKPDYKTIEKNIKDKKSPFYFDSLYERYKAADTSMTLEEKRHLYYGYSFTKNYSPYGTPKAMDDLKELLRADTISKAIAEKAVKIAGTVLNEDPFSIRTLNYRIYLLKMLERHDEAENDINRINTILDAILSTGDGTTEEKCFYVINVSNEYEIIDVLGFDFGGEQRLIGERYDYLTLAENEYELEGFYFDISRSLNSLKF